MRTYFSEKNLVVLLFILVLVVFSIAQSETQKMGKVNGTLLSSAQKSMNKNIIAQQGVTEKAITGQPVAKVANN
jgi:hypothetical protein